MLTLGGLLLTVVSLDLSFNFSNAFDKDLMVQVKLFKRASSFSFAWDLLPVSLESFVGLSCAMTPIAHKSFSTVIVSMKFPTKVAFAVLFTNYAMPVGKAEMWNNK